MAANVHLNFHQGASVQHRSATSLSGDHRGGDRHLVLVLVVLLVAVVVVETLIALPFARNLCLARSVLHRF